jgi:hypothetical protein
MVRAGLWGALAFSVIGGAISVGDASADQQSCAQFRDAIIRMETESVRPPGWFTLDLHLRALYQQDCIAHPTRKPPEEYWYTIDGKPTGVPTSENRPDGADYATTPEINDRCVAAATEPSLCVMIENLRAACANPVDTQERNQCRFILGKNEKSSPPPPGEALPGFRVGLDGGPFELTPNCSALLGRLSGDPLLDGVSSLERGRWQLILQKECPNFLDALKRRTGLDPDRDPGKFWPAVGELAFNGFAPPGTPAWTPASVNADPDWKRMCDQAKERQNTCLTRLSKMPTAEDSQFPARLAPSTTGPGSPTADNPPEPPVRPTQTNQYGANQSDAFRQCAALYGQVLNMCKATENVAKKTAARLPPPVPAKSTPPPATAKPLPPPAPANSQSRPPPQQQAAPGPDCQKLVSNYVGAAQANDGQRALAGYNALKAAGGCGVLDKVGPVTAAAPAAGPDPRFQPRGARPGIDGTFGACSASPAECQAIARQLEAERGPAAQAQMMSNAISVGLQLGGMLANGMMMAMPPNQGGGGVAAGGGRTTDMNSIGNRPARSTYGPGSPDVKCPPQGCAGR